MAMPTTLTRPELNSSSWLHRTGDLLTSWVDRLPYGLDRVIPRDLAGYAVLGLLTFVVGLVLLLLLDRITPLPLPGAVLLADGAAWTLNFWLNRTLNFRSRARVGPEAARYGLVICGDLAISAGVTTLMAGIGLPVLVARIIAGGVITLVGYVTCRFWVFRDRLQPC